MKFPGIEFRSFPALTGRRPFPALFVPLDGSAAGHTHDDLVAHLLTLLGDDVVEVTDALARVSAAARTRR